MTELSFPAGFDLSVAPPPSRSCFAARQTLRELRREHEGAAAAGSGFWPAPGAASDTLTRLLAQLRAATTRYVCSLRAEGARPEQMLVRVKAFVREAMSAEGWHDPEAVRALTTRVVGWSIAAYYDR